MVKEIKFANGLILQPEEVLAKLKASWLGYDDLLEGTAQIDRLNGTGANELILGEAVTISCLVAQGVIILRAEGATTT